MPLWHAELRSVQAKADMEREPFRIQVFSRKQNKTNSNGPIANGCLRYIKKVAPFAASRLAIIF